MSPAQLLPADRSAPVSVACAHCGEPVPASRAPEADEPGFCCNGCATVYAVLHERGLETYYRLGGGRGQRPAVSGRRFAEMDDAGFRERHTRAAGEQTRTVDLYLEGVHCAACVWLVERLPGQVTGVQSCRLDIGRSVARVTWNPDRAPLSEVAQALDSLGYTPHPVRGLDRHEQRQREDRAFLIRTAIAAALAGNVMMISFALYGGALDGMEPWIFTLLRWVALGLSVPAVFGPGGVFLRGAWSAIRTRTPHMDLPVAIALLAGLGYGAWNTIHGAGEVYFDTVTVLVVLLLIGRGLQRRQRRQAVDAAELLESLAPTAARRLEDGEVREVPLEALAVGDVVEVRSGDPVPVDGEVRAGQGRVDAALLTGESRPVRVAVGDRVFAGTACLGGRLEVTVRRQGEETRVARLLEQVESFSRRKAPAVALADRLAGGFVAVVLLLATVTLVAWWSAGAAAAIDHAVALLIVTCPCALGLATPLAFSVALGRAARAGVIVKGGDVLQRLGEARRGGRLWLDKTGTVTEGRSRLVGWEGPDDLRGAVLALEASSAHPVAEGFREAFADVARPLPAVDGDVDEVGGGVAGRVGAADVVVGSPACVAAAGATSPAWADARVAEHVAAARTPVVVARDGHVVAVAGFGDPLRADAAATIRGLQRTGWRVGLLSGDHPEVVAAVAAELGLSEARGGLRPEEKLAAVVADREEGPVVMVGDGVNDAAALAAATVGIGVHGGSEATLAAADVFVARPGTAPIAVLFDLSRGALASVRLSLALSLGYNLVASSLAIAGLVSPLLAAVLMPLSSLTVVASSLRSPTARASAEEPPCP